jgi:lysozyme
VNPTDPTQLALLLIKQYEGFRQTAYQDAGGRWTVGWGFTGPDIGPTSTMTIENAAIRLAATVSWLWKRLDQALGRDVNANQGAALLSLAYNVGLGAVERSVLWGMVQAGQWGPAADQFLRFDKIKLPSGAWDTSKGLQARRRAERLLFLTDPIILT